MSASNYVTIRVEEILKETEAAFLCRINGAEMWLPLSQIADADDYAEGDEDLEISVTEWIARERGLEAADD